MDGWRRCASGADHEKPARGFHCGRGQKKEGASEAGGPPALAPPLWLTNGEDVNRATHHRQGIPSGEFDSQRPAQPLRKFLQLIDGSGAPA